MPLSCDCTAHWCESTNCLRTPGIRIHRQMSMVVWPAQPSSPYLREFDYAAGSGPIRSALRLEKRAPPLPSQSAPPPSAAESKSIVLFYLCLPYPCNHGLPDSSIPHRFQAATAKAAGQTGPVRSRWPHRVRIPLVRTPRWASPRSGCCAHSHPRTERRGLSTDRSTWRPPG